MEDNSFSFSIFYDSSFEQSKDNINEIFNTDIDSISNEYNYNHYFCTNCHKFPFVKFCKNRKKIRLTCSCFNNKKISIEELFKIINIKNSRAIFLPEITLNKNNENHLKCYKHNQKFKGFSKFFLNNYCEYCDEYQNEIYDNDIIRFDEIRIEDKKIGKIIEKINGSKEISEEISEEISNNNIKLFKINENIYEKLLEEEEIRFKKLIDVIIYDYKNYPNFSHFFNIQNLLDFFKIENNPVIKKVEEQVDAKLNKNIDPIIIEYINNNPNKIKLFSKIF